MKLKNIIATTAITLLSSSAFAHQAYIPLEGGTANPGSSVAIAFGKLYKNVDYTVVCTVSVNETDSTMKSTFIKLYGNDAIKYLLNKQVLENYSQAKINARELNILELHHVYSDMNNVGIRNLDQEKSISVQDCYATPASNA